MPNYQNGIIYEIYNDYGEVFYVGSTTVGEDTRMVKHYNQARYVKPDGDPFHLFWKETVESVNGVIGKGDGFHIDIIHRFPCNSLKELEAEEYRVLDEFIAAGVVVLNDRIGGKHSLACKAKMSDAQMGEKHHRFSSGSLKIATMNKGRDKYWRFSYQKAGKETGRAFSIKKYGYCNAKLRAMAERLKIYPNYIVSEEEQVKHDLDMLEHKDD